MVERAERAKSWVEKQGKKKQLKERTPLKDVTNQHSFQKDAETYSSQWMNYQVELNKNSDIPFTQLLTGSLENDSILLPSQATGCGYFQSDFYTAIPQVQGSSSAML